MERVKKILVPTDFSPPSNRALDYAAIMARRFKATIVLVHVIDSFRYSVTDTLNVVDHQRALQSTAGALLDGLKKKLWGRNLRVKTYLSSGTAYHEILKKAEQERVDLIIMGTHGRTGLGRLVLGSVAEKVLRLSPCPVLTVPLAARRMATKLESQKRIRAS